ncbi:MAG: cytochrome C oxidase subunit II [Deltaproteobacteria bacterium GWC2_42_11]|nr:MAG: cytochrome C oxidase subunit II [Deltaproteobacteria bacterium GWC2_42_11]HBO83916.1 cytochrome C oxidase subunit II [Deltaproteobacteria bacterium]
MSIVSPEKGWYSEPLDKEEKVWVAIALAWCLLTFFLMPVWHVVGKQNPSSESYRVDPVKFNEIATAFTEKYKVGEENGIPIVHPPAGSDVFVVAGGYQWRPILELEKGKEYRIHLSSLDFQHGFSLVSPKFVMNYMVLPGYDYVIKVTPTEAGTYSIICNEFCGMGHHIMIGKLIVK